MRATEAVQLATQEKRSLVVRIRGAQGGQDESDDLVKELGLEESSAEDLKSCLENSVVLLLDSTDEDASFLKAAYTDIVEDSALVLISGDNGAQLLVLQGVDLSEQNREAAARKLVEAHKAEERRKLNDWLALATAGRQNNDEAARPTPAQAPTPTSTPASEPAAAEEEEEGEEESDAGLEEAREAKVAAGGEAAVEEGEEADRKPPVASEVVDEPAAAEEVGGAEAEDAAEEEREEDEGPRLTNIAIRMSNGSQLNFELEPTSTLASVYDYIRANRTDGGSKSFSLKIPFSSRSLGEEQSGMTMEELGLHPRTLLILVPGAAAGGESSGGAASRSTSSGGSGFLALLSRLFSLLSSIFASFFGWPQVEAQGEEPDRRAPRRSVDGRRGDQEYWNGNSVEFLSGDNKKDQ